MQHVHGAPCWVQTFQPDVDAAARYYASLFGWEIDGRGDARLGGRLVAGIRPTPGPAVWGMFVRVAEVAEALRRVVAAGGSVLDPGAGVVADAGGVPFGVTADAGVEAAGGPGRWAMSALHAPDLEQASAFYGAVFGWTPETAGPLTQWRLGDRVVAVGTPAGDVPPHWAVNVSVTDVDATARTAAALSGTVLMAPFDANGFRNAVLADPAGAVLAVSAR